MQKPATSNDESLKLNADSEESTKNNSVEMPSVISQPIEVMNKSDKKKEGKRRAHNTLPEANRAKFRNVACEGPSFVCVSCHILCYQTHGTFLEVDKHFLDFIELGAATEEAWFCTRCQSSLKRRKIPGTALANNMRVSEVPKELKKLIAWRSA